MSVFYDIELIPSGIGPSLKRKHKGDIQCQTVLSLPYAIIQSSLLLHESKVLYKVKNIFLLTVNI